MDGTHRGLAHTLTRPDACGTRFRSVADPVGLDCSDLSLPGAGQAGFVGDDDELLLRTLLA
ncbi:hypothetical protein GCM10010276_38160 [Streptomyces longisporus]|uniref:Uncharacterized protein n=1 Tax=Streptomyces longisporus TaxID=1948 RepID=A0ABP5ZAH1_STRLO